MRWPSPSDIRRQDWDDELLEHLRIPRSLLPEVRDSAAEFGMTDKKLFGAAIPIRGIAGDQQAATVGQACFAPGMIKSTYGTGCFLVLNTGDKLVLIDTGMRASPMFGPTTGKLLNSLKSAGFRVLKASGRDDETRKVNLGYQALVDHHALPGSAYGVGEEHPGQQAGKDEQWVLHGSRSPGHPGLAEKQGEDHHGGEGLQNGPDCA